MKRGLPFILLIIVVLILFMAERSCKAERIVRLSDRQAIGFSRMIEEVRGSRLIFIGEDHDRMEDHYRQLKIIKALNDSGTSLAIGLEMFSAESQETLNRWVAGKIDENDFIRVFSHDWNMPWQYYRDIFFYARRHAIPLVGLNVPREIVHKVALEGFGALTPEERKKLPAGITCNVDSAYVAMIRRAFSGHTGNHASFVHFCEAQMLWNKAMARRLQEYSRGYSARHIIVLAGTAHAMKPGIPSELADQAGIDFRVILPEDPAFNRDSVTPADADYLMEN